MTYRIEHDGIGLDKTFKTLDSARKYAMDFGYRWVRDFMMNDEYGNIPVYHVTNKGEKEIGSIFLGYDGRFRYLDMTGRYSRSYLINLDGSLTTGGY